MFLITKSEPCVNKLCLCPSPVCDVQNGIDYPSSEGVINNGKDDITASNNDCCKLCSNNSSKGSTSHMTVCFLRILCCVGYVRGGFPNFSVMKSPTVSELTLNIHFFFLQYT